jgi:hypothetical protein
MSAGSDFRASVADALTLEGADPVWLAVLDQAVAAIDDLELLDASIKEQGLTIVGSKGQPAVCPLLPERRQTRLAVARLLQQLGLADTATTSDRQRKAANARWSKT